MNFLSFIFRYFFHKKCTWNWLILFDCRNEKSSNIFSDQALFNVSPSMTTVKCWKFVARLGLYFPIEVAAGAAHNGDPSMPIKWTYGHRYPGGIRVYRLSVSWSSYTLLRK